MKITLRTDEKLIGGQDGSGISSGYVLHVIGGLRLEFGPRKGDLIGDVVTVVLKEIRVQIVTVKTRRRKEVR